MMNNHIIARRYAKGLLLALSKNNSISVEEQLKTMADLLEDTKDFARICEDPSFSAQERIAVIDKIALKTKIDESLHKFLILLINKGRLSLLPLIYEALTQLLDEQEGRLQVDIRSAIPLAESELNEITRNLAAIRHSKEVRAHNIIDESLLGGVRVEVEGLVFDASLKAKLSALKSKLLHEIGH
jgi:F-type H+-transporting ATPase subunit delta